MALNLKSLLSAIGIASALASPVMAQPTVHRHHKSAVVAPDFRAGVMNHGYNAQVQTVYAPDVPQPAHNAGLNPDFQLGAEK